jgi:hypothetical protein
MRDDRQGTRSAPMSYNLGGERNGQCVITYNSTFIATW